MTTSNIKATLPYRIEEVWDIVTSLKDDSWRSDVSKIEIKNECIFIEYTKAGYPTTFTITKKEPYHIYEFDMENDNMSGHWIGLFSKSGEGTTIDFTEIITTKKIIMKPFVKMYLKKQQSNYVNDLKKALYANKNQ